MGASWADGLAPGSLYLCWGCVRALGTADFPSPLWVQEDLMNTIGESAAQGAAGIILWGTLDYSASKVSAGGGSRSLSVGTPSASAVQGCDTECHCRTCA